MRSLYLPAQPNDSNNEHPSDIQNLHSYINDVIANTKDLQSNSYRVAITSFQKYVKAKYQKSSLENEESNFLNDLFCSISISNLSDPLHYVILANSLIGIDIGSKISKANHIARDIPSLPPSSISSVYILLEKILVWLSNVLGSTMHIILQPLREKIWSLSQKKDDTTSILTSLNLLNIFLIRFPSALNANFENIQILLFSTIQSTNRSTRLLSVRVLESAFKLTKTPHTAHILPLFFKLTSLISNTPSSLQSDIIAALLKKCEKNTDFASAFKFDYFPIQDLKESEPAQRVFPLIYLCNPSIFDNEQLRQVLNAYFYAIKRDSNNRSKLCISLGQVAFMLGQRLNKDFPNESSNLFKYLYKLPDKSDQVRFAIFSLMSDETDEFYDILQQAFSTLLSKVILKGLGKLIQKWPSKSPMIRKKVMGALTATMVNAKSDSLISYSFSALQKFNISMKEISNDLVFYYSLFLSHPTFKVRKSCATFLLSMQNYFPFIRLRLLSFVGTETHEELRVSIFENLGGENKELISPLIQLFHDSASSVRRLALIKLCNIQGATPFISNYVNEVVSCLKQGVVFSKLYMRSMCIISDKLPILVRPYSDFLIDRILHKSQKTSKVALELLSKLIPNSNNIDIESLVSLLSMSLSKHSTPHKIHAAIELCIVSLQFTKLRETIRTQHLHLFIKLLSLYKVISRSNNLKNRLFTILIKIGPINPVKIDQNSIQNSNMMQFVAFMDMTNNPKVAQLLNLSVITSLHLVMEILNDESLANIQQLALEALLSILKYFPPTDSVIDKAVLQTIIEIYKNSKNSMINQIPTILRIFNDKSQSIISDIVDSLFSSWGKIDTSLILRTINWLSITVPDYLQPHLQKLTVLITTSISLQPYSIVKEIMTAIATFGRLLQTVDYIVIPCFMNFIEINANNSETANDALSQFKIILSQCDVTKFSASLVKSCIVIVKQNTELTKNAIKILLVILYQMRESFAVFLSDLLLLFDLQNDSDYLSMTTSIKLNEPFDPKIIEGYGKPPSIQNPAKATASTAIDQSNVQFKKPNKDWDSDEWCHWCDEFIPLFLTSSSSRAILSCASLCERDYNIRSMLFPISFALSALNDHSLQESVIKTVMTSKTVPTTVLTHFVSICELMEVSGQAIPVTWDLLSERAINTAMMPLALRFTEHIFESFPDRAAERLVFLNQSLGLNDAADAVLYYSHEFNVNLCKQLGKWEEAYTFYTNELEKGEYKEEYMNGKLESLENLGRFIDLKEEVTKNKSSNYYSALACLRTFSFDEFKEIMENTMDDSNEEYHTRKSQFFLSSQKDMESDLDNVTTGSYYESKIDFNFLIFESIYYILKNDFDNCSFDLETLHETMPDLILLPAAEDYKRSFNHFCHSCILEEIEDVIELNLLKNKITSAVLKEKENALAEMKKIEQDWEKRFDEVKNYPLFLFTLLIIRNLALDEKKMENYYVKFLLANAVNGLTQSSQIVLDKITNCSTDVQYSQILMLRNAKPGQKNFTMFKYSETDNLREKATVELAKLNYKVDVLAKWLVEDGKYQEAIDIMKSQLNHGHLWSKANYLLFKQTSEFDFLKTSFKELLTELQLGQSTQFNRLTYALKTLSIVFEHQDKVDLFDLLLDNVNKISPSIWLPLLPQIIARISTNNLGLRHVVHSLVLDICTQHPNPVLSSLIVPLSTATDEKHQIALQLVDKIKEMHPQLVIEADQFYGEIRNIAQTQWETWYNAIDEASKAYVIRKDKSATYQLLYNALHKQLGRQPTSLYEVLFASQYESRLMIADDYLTKSLRPVRNPDNTTEIEIDGSLKEFEIDDMYLNEAWSIYVNIYREINPFITSIHEIDLNDVSPSLASLQKNKTSVYVPGTETAISHFDNKLIIMKSKQRPRKIAMTTIDGIKKTFLLKSNEDTRLDQRAMQLFNVVSDFLHNRTLHIETYHVLPISSKVGLIGWIEDTETIFELIKNERKKWDISMTAEIDSLKSKEKELMMKVVVYNQQKHKEQLNNNLAARVHALKRMLSQTRGNEIRKYLMETSINANDWVKRRISYTSSLAVTSMAGYLIGIGDRHLQNIMMKCKMARIVHIDFGDCFEVLKKRDRFPEMVPFRLTRVFLNGLEVTQVDGTFRKRCEEVMSVIRDNGEMVSELLETFIYDPLLNCETIFGEATEIVERIKEKLNGSDFHTEKPLNVQEQVDYLIKEATNLDNLVLMYSGWNPWF